MGIPKIFTALAVVCLAQWGTAAWAAEPLKQLGVTIQRSDGSRVASCTTDWDGKCRLAALPPGSYRAVIQAEPLKRAVQGPSGSSTSADGMLSIRITAGSQTFESEVPCCKLAAVVFTVPPNARETTIGVTFDRRKAVGSPAATAVSEGWGEICVSSFNDLNANGVWNQNEPVLTGRNFKATGASYGWATSNSAAYPYRCRGVPPGTYTVIQYPVAGWTNTAPAGATAQYVVTVGVGQQVNRDFGSYQLPQGDPGPVGGTPGQEVQAQICADKYEDINGNGKRDPGEPPLVGWTFTLKSAAGNIVGQGLTNMQGRTCMNLPVKTIIGQMGPYVLLETPKPGWTNTEPGSGQKSGIPAPAVLTVVPFGNRRVAPPPLVGGAGPVQVPQRRICVEKYEDINGNGVRDQGEGPLAGWSFSLLGSGNTVINQGTTNAEGLVCFILPPRLIGSLAGPYTVRETLQPGWTNTEPGGTAPQRSGIGVPSPMTTLRFGNRRTTGSPSTGRICVMKYEDLDGDGDYGGGEGPLSGWRFTVGQRSGDTNAQGRVCFEVPAGTHVVRETLRPGWVSTDPGGTAPQKSATVGPGQTIDLYFGNRRK